MRVMNSIRQKFYVHIANNGLKENDVWTVELQDKFYSVKNSFGNRYFIKESCWGASSAFSISNNVYVGLLVPNSPLRTSD